jgi:hypothetical protein
MWEIRCNRALRKAGFSEGVTRQSLQAQGIKRPATQHLGPKATAIARNGCRLRKAEVNREIFTVSRRMAEIEYQLQHLKKDHAHRVPTRNPHDRKSAQMRSPIWQERATRIDPSQSAKPTGWLCVEHRALPITETDLLEIIPGRGLHIRTRQESWLVSLPEELQSDELLRAITSGKVNCLSGSYEPFEPPCEPSK